MKYVSQVPLAKILTLINAQITQVIISYIYLIEMENLETPTKKLKTIDVKRCVICQKTGKLCQPKSCTAYNNIIKCMKSRRDHGDTTYNDTLAILEYNDSFNSFEKFCENGAS